MREEKVKQEQVIKYVQFQKTKILQSLLLGFFIHMLTVLFVFGGGFLHFGTLARRSYRGQSSALFDRLSLDFLWIIFYFQDE